MKCPNCKSQNIEVVSDYFKEPFLKKVSTIVCKDCKQAFLLLPKRFE